MCLACAIDKDTVSSFLDTATSGQVLITTQRKPQTPPERAKPPSTTKGPMQCAYGSYTTREQHAVNLLLDSTHHKITSK